MDPMIRYIRDKALHPELKTIYYINGYKVFICRNVFDVNCGYVLLPLNHQYENVTAENIPLNVHGGITYSDKQKDGWVIGFDTCHLGDFTPQLINHDAQPNSHYWTHEEVLTELNNLIEQLC